MLNQSPQSLDLSRVRRTLHEHGQRLTRLKREVLGVLGAAEGALTVDELARSIDDTADPSPLYRCLTALEEAHIVTQVGLGDGVRRYALHEGFGHHHDYLVCSRCSAIEEVHGCLLAQEAERQARRRGFLVKDHQVILRGICQDCRTAEEV